MGDLLVPLHEWMCSWAPNSYLHGVRTPSSPTWSGLPGPGRGSGPRLTPAPGDRSLCQSIQVIFWKAFALWTLGRMGVTSLPMRCLGRAFSEGAWVGARRVQVPSEVRLDP